VKLPLKEKSKHGQHLWDRLMLRDCPEHFVNTCIMIALKKHNPDATYLKNGKGHKVCGVRADQLKKLDEVDEIELDRFIEFAEQELLGETT
jgi:hypothetical protein